MNNLEEMDKFLEKYNFTILNQEEFESMNRPITSIEIETVNKNLPTNKSPGPDGFTSKFYQMITENLTHILIKLFQKFTEGEDFPNSFSKATIILILKPDQKKKKNHKNIHL